MRKTLLVITLSIMFSYPLFAQDISVKLQKIISASQAAIIDANDSHNGIIDINMPYDTEIAIVFSGNDYALETHDTHPSLHSKILNEGAMVIINATGKEGTVYTLHIRTRDKRLHTLRLTMLNKNIEAKDIQAKTIIADDKSSILGLIIKDKK